MRSWIARNCSIDASSQILMTARGKQVKPQTLSVERELFLYDRQILSDNRPSTTPIIPEPDSYVPKPAPDSPSKQDSLPAWQNLFRDRRFWALELAKRCSEILRKVNKLNDEAIVIQRCAAIAVENVKQHLGNLRPKYEDAKVWADRVLEDQSFLLGQWDATVGKYTSLLAIQKVAACLHGAPRSSRDSDSSDGTYSSTRLYDFVDISEVTKASNAGKNTSEIFRNRTIDMSSTFDDIVRDASEIVESFAQVVNASDNETGEHAKRLIEEVDVVSQKIDADYHHVIGLPNSPKSINQVLRTALLHTRNFIPSLVQTAVEVDHLHKRAVERKNHITTASIHYLQSISAIESRIAQVHSKVASLDIDGEDGQAFDILNSVMRLPYVYGMLLVECARRIEWAEKITADSSTLVEEVAVFKEEEAKRRKKWLKDMDGAIDLDPIDEMSLGVDINVKADKQKWPKVVRKDISDYLESLRDLKGFEDFIKDIEVAARDLDSPTRQQARRAKAFKSGSIYDASYGKNSLLLRGDDDLLQGMKIEKSKLEDKLKSSESRIRKLEDLLHRQTQISRPLSSGNAFSAAQQVNFDRQGSSPTTQYGPFPSKPPETGSRRSSVSSWRISTNEPEDKALTRRIVSLEAELVAEKTQSANLQKSAAARLNAEDKLKIEVQDALSIKQDLMENLDAQQREFDYERRLLEDDNAKLKVRLEEAEDELDRVFGSRSHEEKINFLEEELESVRKERALEVQKHHEQAEVLRNEHETQLKKNDTLERQVQQQDLRKADLEAEITQLSLQLEDNQCRCEHLQRDKAGIEAELKDRDNKLDDLKHRLGNEEMEVFAAREKCAQQQEQINEFELELKRKRGEHEELRSAQDKEKTAFETTRATLAENEHRMEILSENLNTSNERNRNLDAQLTSQRKSEDDMKKVNDKLQKRLDDRAERAAGVSRRLLSLLSSLERLMEHVGLTFVKENDGSMTIQKVSKATSTSTTLNDPSTSLYHSISGPSFVKATFEDSKFISIQRWADAQNEENEEQQYGEYVRSLDAFDIEAFHEAIIKRVKDAEHLAKKWQREARGYRDKSHRSQSEAHEKIAFRGFKEGDLALFLPTRNQATRPWAAFNVGAPHYFLREQDSHKLRTRDWLLARISKVEERVVNLSRSINGLNPASDRRSLHSDGGASFDDENPFELSDGLRWYLLDAAEEKAGAPINVGSGKVTVASANVDAKGSIRMKKSLDGKDGATKTLTRSLDSRRSSTNSKKGQGTAVASPLPPGSAGDASASNDGPPKDAPKQEISSDTNINISNGRNTEEVCRDLLWGP